MSKSLITAVADMLAEHNQSAATRFIRDFQESGDSVKDIHQLNDYWREQLRRLHCSTITARSCLIDDIEPHDWLRHFKMKVLPVLVSHDLPR